MQNRKKKPQLPWDSFIHIKKVLGLNCKPGTMLAVEDRNHQKYSPPLRSSDLRDTHAILGAPYSLEHSPSCLQYMNSVGPRNVYFPDSSSCPLLVLLSSALMESPPGFMDNLTALHVQTLPKLSPPVHVSHLHSRHTWHFYGFLEI